MGTALIDLLWIFAVLFGITYGHFVAHTVTEGEFWIALTLIYVGGQWIMDRRAQIVISQEDVDEAVQRYLDGDR